MMQSGSPDLLTNSSERHGAASTAQPRDLDRLLFKGRISAVLGCSLLGLIQMSIGRPAQVAGAEVCIGAGLYGSAMLAVFIATKLSPTRAQSVRMAALPVDALFAFWMMVHTGEWVTFLYPFAIGSIRTYEAQNGSSSGRIDAGILACGFIAGIPFSPFWSEHPAMAIMAMFGFGMLAWGPGELSLVAFAQRARREIRLRNPISGAPASAPALKTAPQSAVIQNDPDRVADPKGSVLLVEPNRASAFLLSRVLSRAGYRVVSATTSEQATSALMEHGAATLDALLIDAGMPEADSILAARNPRMAAIGLDRSTLSHESSTGSALQFDARLNVPVDFAVLIETLGRLTGLKDDIRFSSPEFDAASSDAEQPVGSIDLRALRDLEKLGGPDFVRDIINQFVADGAAALHNLAQSMASGNVGLFRDQAHALRSSAANVGARSIYSTCLAWREIEADDLDRNGPEQMRELQQQFENASRMLTEYVAELQAAAMADDHEKA